MVPQSNEARLAATGWISAGEGWGRGGELEPAELLLQAGCLLTGAEDKLLLCTRRWKYKGDFPGHEKGLCSICFNLRACWKPSHWKQDLRKGLALWRYHGHSVACLAISFNLFPLVNLSSLYLKLLLTYSKSVVCGLAKPALRYYKPVVFLGML